MQSKLTIIGMYEYDPTLFDNMQLPEGIDGDTVRDEILMKSGEFETLYPDPDFMKLAIGHWSKKHYRTFNKWLTALNIEYDPLYNYDRTEEYTDERTGTSAKSGETGRTFSNGSTENRVDSENMSDSETTTGDRTSNNVGSSTGHTSESTSPAQTTNTKTTTVAAFDSSSYQPKEQTTDALTLQVAGSDSSDTTSTTGSSENEATNTSKSGSTNRNATGSNERNETGSDELKTNETANNNEIITHKARLFGNIGVTTSQQMLQSELDIARFNLFEQIADLFVSEFCIMIY